MVWEKEKIVGSCVLDRTVEDIMDPAEMRYLEEEDGPMMKTIKVLIVEESGCIQAKVYLQCELFTKYEYGAQGRPRFGISLRLLVDCLNTFSSPGHSNTIEIKYPGPDMELLLKLVDTLNACTYSEIRTRIPETEAWDYNF